MFKLKQLEQVIRETKKDVLNETDILLLAGGGDADRLTEEQEISVGLLFNRFHWRRSTFTMGGVKYIRFTNPHIKKSRTQSEEIITELFRALIRDRQKISVKEFLVSLGVPHSKTYVNAVRRLMRPLDDWDIELGKNDEGLCYVKKSKDNV